MEIQTGITIKPQFFQTHLATFAFLAMSILPNAVYSFPSQKEQNIKHLKIGDLDFNFASQMTQEQQYSQIIEDFAGKLLGNLVDTDEDIARITSKRFFDMYEDF